MAGLDRLVVRFEGLQISVRDLLSPSATWFVKWLPRTGGDIGVGGFRLGIVAVGLGNNAERTGDQQGSESEVSESFHSFRWLEGFGEWLGT